MGCCFSDTHCERKRYVIIDYGNHHTDHGNHHKYHGNNHGYPAQNTYYAPIPVYPQYPAPVFGRP